MICVIVNERKFGKHIGLFSHSLLGNPVTTKPHYRQYVVNKVPQLRILDFRKINMKVRYLRAMFIPFPLHYMDLSHLVDDGVSVKVLYHSCHLSFTVTSRELLC